jgi:ribosomal protein L44E
MSYPCGKTEMDIIDCPDCLDHFSECATKSRAKDSQEIVEVKRVYAQLIQTYAAIEKSYPKGVDRATKILSKLYLEGVE